MIFPTTTFLTCLSFAVSHAQQIGTAVPEVHPKLPIQKCTTAGGCVTRRTVLVTDALSRNIHAKDDPSVSCNTKPLNATLCPTAEACAQNCVLEGVDYTERGVLTQGTALTLRMYIFNGTKYAKASPRLYLLAEDKQNYEMLRLTNQELTYDVDVSQLGCGMNSALYLSEMEESGARSALNPAGASYGTGYCDAQCFNTSSFFNGVANLNHTGACCHEMDIWEANNQATALTPHTCSSAGSFPCLGAACTKDATLGVCDKGGCANNPFEFGARNFYGPGLTVDTSKPFTVVTQFLTNNNSPNGTLTEIKRMYIQEGRLIENALVTNISGKAVQMEGTVNQDFCTARNASAYLRLGGMEGMGQSLSRGMVLIFSLWNSDGDFMEWLDAGDNGPCNATAGDPAGIVATTPQLSVTFSNIKYGDIGSTFNTTGLSVVQASGQAEQSRVSFVLLGLGLLAYLAV